MNAPRDTLIVSLMELQTETIREEIRKLRNVTIIQMQIAYLKLGGEFTRKWW